MITKERVSMRSCRQNMPRRPPFVLDVKYEEKGREKNTVTIKVNEIGLHSAILHPEYVSPFNESVSHFGFWRHDLISQLERRLINMTGLGATAAKREMGR